MSSYDGMPVNFTFASAAKAEISNLKKIWNRQISDPADVLAIAWGATVLHSGRRTEGVIVSFYGESERDSVKHGIERVAGLEVVFFITEADYARFDGRTLDFSTDRGFYLRR